MTEQNRGAYAPQNDAPLAFDPRRDGGRRGPPPLTLIIGFIVLMALAAGVALLYRHGARRPGQPPQVVGSPIGETKSLPDSSQALSDANAGLQVYKTEVPPTAEQPAPSFAAPPEQPQPRPISPPPAPQPVNVTTLRPAEPAPAPPAVVVKVAARTAKAPPPTVAKTAPPAATAQPPKPVAAVKPPKPAAAAPTPAPATAVKPAAAPAAGGVVAQIGSETSAALADKAWSDAARKIPAQMTGKSRKVETFNKNGTIFYRALVGGFASHADAQSFCAALKGAGGVCIVR